MTEWEAATSAIWRRAAPHSLDAYCRLALLPMWQEPAAHHTLLIRELERLASTPDGRLIIMMPPGSAKSTYTSKLFSSWLMMTGSGVRDFRMIGAANTDDLARQFSLNTLALVREHGRAFGGVFPARSAVEWWGTSHGAEYRAAGIGKAISGVRADVAIIDDPIASSRLADSEAVRETQWQWFLRDIMGRLKPGGRIALVMTRWHEDDLAGRLLTYTPEQWRTVKIQAIAGDDDPLGRQPGAWLWDTGQGGYGEGLRLKKSVFDASGDRRGWSALYQQDPRPPEGLLFKVTALRVLDTAPSIPWEIGVPANVPPPYVSPVPDGAHPQHGTGIAGAVTKIVRRWDLAATVPKGGGDPDWTVGLKMARLDTGTYVVLDVVRMRGGPDDVEAAIINTAAQDGAQVTIGLPQDPGQAGKVQVAYLTRRLAGYTVKTAPETGDKVTRAGPAASQVNVGNVALVRAAWNRALIEEMRDFPTGRHDDCVDALSGAMAMLATTPPPARRITLPIMGR